MKAAADFWRSKTTWAGIAVSLSAVASWLAGSETFAQAEQQIAVALLGMFIRDAVVKSARRP